MLQALKQLATLLHRYTLGWLPRANTRRVGPASPRAQAHQSKNKKRTPRQQRLHMESLEDRRVFAAGFAEFIDPNPAPGNQFGASVVPLSTGNVVITSPYDDAGGPDAGAVYLFNGRTGKLISTLTGSQPDDHVGISGVAVLTNGNFVVPSPEWDNGTIQDVGAATWGSGTSGITGMVTAENSLIGSSAGDKISSRSVNQSFFPAIQALKNGNYVVTSVSWDNGNVVDAGAVTWGDGTQGIHGEITPDNSLVGSTAGDQVGLQGVNALTNGNYVVASRFWDNGDAVDAGASTFGNGSIGTSGTISEANSLVGTMTNDWVGSSNQVLPNGNYVVYSSNWHSGTGAATFADGTVGVTGVISADNSLVGSKPGDGSEGFLTVLKNGNYVVPWNRWDNGTVEDVGAVTFGSGTTGIKGVVSADISLVGSSAFDRIGQYPISVLTNGNYVVGSPSWRGGSPLSALGAATLGDGTVGVRGVVSAANSLVGSSNFDRVGAVVALTNGNYVVVSPGWDDGEIVDVGAVTLGNGVTGTIGEISAASSLIGTSTGDQVGGGTSTSSGPSRAFGVFALKNGNYLVNSPFWNNNAVQDAGAVTLGDGVTRTMGLVNASNSLVGSTAGDQVGFDTVFLANGNYVVISPKWDNGETADVGAATFVNGQTGLFSIVNEANSLVGSTPNDQVGSNNGNSTRSLALSNGNYLISSSMWDFGDIEDAGAVTFGSGTTGVHGQIDGSNSLVATNELSISGMSALSTGNYLIVSTSWDNGTLANAGAVFFGNGTTGMKGEFDSSNSAIGDSENAQLGAIVVDDLNRNFYARFLADGGGRVRVGSQIDGFSRPWHFVTHPQDVNNDGHVVAQDVLSIINYINAGHSSDVPTDATLGKPYGFLDVTGDGHIVAEDVIAVINYINADHPTEGEAATSSITPAASLPSNLPIPAAPTPTLNDSLLLLLASDASSAKKRR